MLQIDKIAHTSGLKGVGVHLRVTLPLLLLIAMAFVNSYWIGIAMLVATSLISLIIGRVPPRLYFESLLAPAFFVVTAVIGILFVTQTGGAHVLVQLGTFSLYITDLSLKSSILTVSRAYGSLGLVYLIAFHNTIWELGQYMLKMKMPKTFVELFVLCYRFIFILLEEGYEMVHAQDLRLGYVSIDISMKSLSLLISQLFIRTLMRARQMEDSLEMRLYQGDFLIQQGGKVA